MADATQADVTPGEWTGVYYDSEAGELVSVDFRDDGSVALMEVVGDAELHTFPSHAAFAEIEHDLIEIPEHAVEDPVAVARQAYNKGYEQIMSNELEGDIALLYADTQIEVVEKSD